MGGRCIALCIVGDEDCVCVRESIVDVGDLLALNMDAGGDDVRWKNMAVVQHIQGAGADRVVDGRNCEDMERYGRDFDGCDLFLCGEPLSNLLDFFHW